MNTKNQIISKTPVGRPPALSTNSPSTVPTDNPFETIFDGKDEDEDSWKDEHTSSIIPSGEPSQSKSLENITTSRIGNVIRTVSRRERKSSISKVTREKSKGRQRKLHTKLRLQIQTNFSTHHGPRPQVLSSQQSRPNGFFVDLTTLRKLENVSAHPNGTLWTSLKNKKSKAIEYSPEKSKVNTLDSVQSKTLTVSPLAERRGSSRPTNLKLGDDLSPDDRPIVIGISIPSARLAHHTTTPQTSTSIASNMMGNYGHETPTGKGLSTPSIVITPAQEISVWSPYSTASNVSRTRTLSTSYSVASPNDPFRDGAPPLPTMPAALAEEEKRRVAAQHSYFSPDSDATTEWDEEPSSTRVLSSCIIYEEDEHPIIVRSARPPTLADAPKVDNHGSMDTIAVRARSGWWNYITTPFLTRSNTLAYPEKKSPDVPEDPILAIAAAKAQESKVERKSWEQLFSPLSIRRTASNASDDWWDVTPLGFRSEKQVSPGLVYKETRHAVKPSTAALPFVRSTSGDVGDARLTRFADLNITVNAVHSINFISTHDYSGISNSLQKSSISVNKETSLSSTADRTKELGSNNPFVQTQNSNINLYNNSSMVTSTDSHDSEIKSRILVNHSTSPPPPPPYFTESPKKVRKYRAVLPPSHEPAPASGPASGPVSVPVTVSATQYPASPGPISPGMQQAMASKGSIQLSEVPLSPAHGRTNQNTAYPGPTRQTTPTLLIMTQEHLQQIADKAAVKAAKKAESKRQKNEKEDRMARKAGGLWAGRGCIPKNGCHGRQGPEGRKRRRWYCCIFISLVLLIVLILVLAMTLTRKPKHVVMQSQWLNLTGFPPIYAGLSTVAAPVNIVANTGCVFPATQWSCALPKEQQSSVAPNLPNQPNFLLEIQWDNSSAANATFANVTGNKNLPTRNIVGNPVSAGKFIRDLILKARQSITFNPSPPPPSYAEEAFLGDTTDGIVSTNKVGEPTPFYISFLPTTSTTLTSNSRVKRANSNATDPNLFPNITSGIPAPSLNADGTAAPANLLPYPVQQPIRLYDRGLITEHYGFYTYFNRSIFLKSLSLLNDTNTSSGEVPDDQNGGALEGEANFRCTWGETRFLVQMWTRMNGTARLNNATSSTGASTVIARQDFSQPGSFPYPITITTDRHGGDPARKLLYCYSMNDREGIIASSGVVNGENRAFGGQIVNPAPSIFSNVSDSSLGGFDGGTGGCSCSWSNFQEVLSAGGK
ncbi:hypothetical protein SS1G_01425 [Sclerotinia sclerotiorum 1980 UF-70]|uniref:Glycoprotease family protein n=2 Tax=Sclerotinia sclerotiorum (strain ATCC 18683 / 1980 / Ss-1) TaxID=665079 RepID=A7E7Z7_SCLS1|nr:hypothetical protein SS1G_01425 [Sclerotinia sclerotiorum 1980 UF-70]APA06126.1 hypothetical protein sscle_01g008960 [Sclerotinia sclerotiorum 1980 UF-70]EDN96499.1 hypothetical protein SS1G_01425 [Sclerotinia sclerotiorum 1980 UF-70]